ncbi:MAG: hypothetical protein KAS75_01505 [Planctomycetes bacterium]|nr:hypothetical protein [Planctomycetota bacterium]
MEADKKKKSRKFYWLFGDLLIAAVIIVMFLHKPAYFKPSGGVKSRQVSTYITHELSPQFYNAIQLQKPFNIVVRQKDINGAIAQSGWPKESEDIKFSTPMVFFVPDRIVLMGTAVMAGIEFVVTVESEPSFDETGLLNLTVTKVKIGAVHITLLARTIAKRMYAKRLAETDVDADSLRAKIAASLLDGEPFEPVFEVEDKKIRVEKVTITQGKLTIRFVPVFQPDVSE